MLPELAGAGEVRAPATADVAEHLAACPACAFELSLLRAVASLPVPAPSEGMDGAWAEELPAAVLAEAARREEALLSAVASFPVPGPGDRWSSDLPERVRREIISRRRWRAPAVSWWWAGGAAAAAAALLLAVRLYPPPLSLEADGEFVLAVNASPVALGHASDLALADDAGQDWLEGLEELDLDDLEDAGVYHSPVPADWYWEREGEEDPAAPGADEGRDRSIRYSLTDDG